MSFWVNTRREHGRSGFDTQASQTQDYIFHEYQQKDQLHVCVPQSLNTKRSTTCMRTSIIKHKKINYMYAYLNH